jgi:hypothetical protein
LPDPLTLVAIIGTFLIAGTVKGVIGLGLPAVSLALLAGLLGVLLMVYAGVGLAGVPLAVPARHEAWLGVASGAVNGVLTGMTGSFVVPGVMFLQAIGLPRDRLVQAMGMLFTVSTVALAVALQANALLTAQLGPSRPRPCCRR